MKKQKFFAIIGVLVTAIASLVSLGTASYWFWHQPKTPKSIQ